MVTDYPGKPEGWVIFVTYDGDQGPEIGVASSRTGEAGLVLLSHPGVEILDPATAGQVLARDLQEPLGAEAREVAAMHRAG